MKRLAISKSNYTLKEIQSLLNMNNINIKIYKKKLYYKIQDLNLEVILVRPKDIVRLIETKDVDYGLVGEDIIIENKTTNINYKVIGKDVYKHYICGLNTAENFQISNLNGKLIYTQHPQITKIFLKENNISSKINSVQGSSEAYLQMFGNCYIEDVVDTGISLKENNGQKLIKIFESKLCLVYREIDKFIKNFKPLKSSQILKEKIDLNKFSIYLNYLDKILENRKNNPNLSYTSNLLNESNREKIIQKLIEEIIEVSLELYKEDNYNSIIYEAADMFFHFLLLLKYEKISFNAIIDELNSRKK